VKLEVPGVVGRAGPPAQAVGGARSGEGAHDLALALALGGDCLADVTVLRAEPGVFGPVASDPTVSRTLDVPTGNVTPRWR
jgi:hypothetical protein